MRQLRATSSAAIRLAPGLLLALLLVPCAAPAASAQVNVSIGVPSIDIGIHFPTLPALTIVPGTPVYYAPSVDANANLFFYDGMYWVLRDETWYASSWYNGPWAVVDPDIVPDFLLRVPVRYYRHPPAYFHGWAATAPPRWGEHWGQGWEAKHAGWEHAAQPPIPRAAPVPTYQRQYTGKRYPAPQQQAVLHSQHYKYQPHEPVVQQHYQQHAAPQQHGHAQRDEGRR